MQWNDTVLWAFEVTVTRTLMESRSLQRVATSDSRILCAGRRNWGHFLTGRHESTTDLEVLMSGRWVQLEFLDGPTAGITIH
jgi:hypothetical protein